MAKKHLLGFFITLYFLFCFKTKTTREMKTTFGTHDQPVIMSVSKNVIPLGASRERVVSELLTQTWPRGT